MLQSEFYEKYPYPLIDLLKLDAGDPYTQDWEWCVSDEDRVEEFLNFYRSMPLDDRDKMSLMMIILDSYNDRMWSRGQGDPAVWQMIDEFLRQDLRFYKEQILYWSSVDYADNEMDDAWAIAPGMRQLLVELHRNSYLSPEDYQNWSSDLLRLIEKR